MDKKTLAFILIGVAALAGLYFLYKKRDADASAAALGAGMADARGSWAAEDDALYKKFRSKFGAGELNWIDPAVKALYESGGGNIEDQVNGVPSKAGSFARVIYNVAPNEDGKYPPVHWAGQSTRALNIAKYGGKMPSLFPITTIDSLYNDFSAFKVKYGGL